MAFGPADIHARQHGRPIAAFRAACARVDFKVGVLGVRFPIQQRFKLLGRGFLGERFDGGLGILDDPTLDVGFETVEDDDSLELDDSLDLGAIEALPADDLDAGLTDDGGTDPSGLPALPPMPDFNPDAREAG